MAASENDSGTLADRMATIQRRIEKSDKPKTLYNPSKPTSNFDLIRLSIKLKAEALGLQFFYDCPSRPSSVPRSMRSTAKSESKAADAASGGETTQLAQIQEAYDSGNALFFDVVHMHMLIENDAIALEVERSFTEPKRGIEYLKWFLAKGDRSTPARQKLLRMKMRDFRLTNRDCESAAKIDEALQTFFEQWCLIDGHDPTNLGQLSDAIDIALDAFPHGHSCQTHIQTLVAINGVTNSKWKTWQQFRTELNVNLERWIKPNQETMMAFQAADGRRPSKTTGRMIPAADEKPAVLSPMWTESESRRPQNDCTTCSIEGCTAQKNYTKCFANPDVPIEQLPIHRPRKRYNYMIGLCKYAMKTLGRQSLRGFDIPSHVKKQYRNESGADGTIAANIDMSQGELDSIYDMLTSIEGEDQHQSMVLTRSNMPEGGDEYDASEFSPSPFGGWAENSHEKRTRLMQTCCVGECRCDEANAEDQGARSGDLFLADEDVMPSQCFAVDENESEAEEQALPAPHVPPSRENVRSEKTRPRDFWAAAITGPTESTSMRLARETRLLEPIETDSLENAERSPGILISKEESSKLGATPQTSALRKRNNSMVLDDANRQQSAEEETASISALLEFASPQTSAKKTVVWPRVEHETPSDDRELASAAQPETAPRTAAATGSTCTAYNDRNHTELRDFLCEAGIAPAMHTATLRALQGEECNTVEDLPFLVEHVTHSMHACLRSWPPACEARSPSAQHHPQKWARTAYMDGLLRSQR